MRISCEQCQADIIINESNLSDQSLRSTCLFCSAQFSIHRNEQGGYDVVFESNRKFKRSCINCGSQFPASTLEGIPRCPRCLGSNRANSIEPNQSPQHLDSQSARDKTPVDEKLELAHPLPSIPLASGNEQKKKNPAVMRVALASRRTRRRRYITLLLVLVVALTATVYLLLNQPIGIEDHPAAINLIDNIKQKHSRTPLNDGADPTRWVHEAQTIITMDQIHLFPRAIELVEQALLYDSTSRVDAINLLLKLYGLSAMNNPYPQLLETTSQLSEVFRLFAKTRWNSIATQFRLAFINRNTHAMVDLLKVIDNIPDVDPVDHAALIGLATVLHIFSDQQKIDKALQDLTRQIEAHPNHLELRWILAILQNQQLRPDQAAILLQQRINLIAHDVRAHFELGKMALRSRDFAGAKNYFKMVLRYNPSNIEARFHLARIHHLIDEHLDLAHVHLLQLLTRYSDLLDATTEQAIRAELLHVLIGQNRLMETVAHEASLAMAPSPSTANIIARLRLMLAFQKSKQAIQLAQTYLATNPSAAPVWFQLGQLNEHVNQPTQAVEAYQRALMIAPHWTLPYYFLIRLHLRQGRVQQALTLTSDAIHKAIVTTDSETMDPMIHSLTAAAWADLVQSLNTLVKAHKTSAALQTLVGAVYFEQGIDRQNNFLVNQGARNFVRATQNTKTLDYPYLCLGRAYLYLGKNQDALRVLRRAIELDQQRSANYYWLAVAQRRNKLFLAAQTNLSKAELDSAWQHRSLYQQGLLHLDQGDTQRAIEQWRQALRTQPDDHLAWGQLFQHGLQQAQLNSSPPP